MYEDRANNRAYLTQNSFLSVNPSQLLVEEVLDAVIASVSSDGDTVGHARSHHSSLGWEMVAPTQYEYLTTQYISSTLGGR
jgi:hypothetical protein